MNKALLAIVFLSVLCKLYIYISNLLSVLHSFAQESNSILGTLKDFNPEQPYGPTNKPDVVSN